MTNMVHDDFGKLPEYRIGIVGAKSSGKSNFMVAAVWQLTQEFAPSNEVDIGFGSYEEETVYRQYVELLEQGLVMQKTVPAPVPKAFTISMRSANGRGCRLFLYDAAGEDYEVEEHLANHPLERYDAILFVVDPFAEEGARRGLIGQIDPAELQRTNPAPLESSEILARLVNVLERVLKERVGGVFCMPLAVVVTKIDACGLVKRLRLEKDWMRASYSDLETASDHAEHYSPRTWELLCTLGLGNLLSILESRFARVAFFPVSSLGRSMDGQNRARFQPFGVLAPLLWLCYHTDALSDRDEFELWFKSVGTGVRRRLRGFQGTSAFLLAWGVLAFGLLVWLGCITVVILCITQVLSPALMLVGFAQFAVLGLLPLILYHQWVRRRFRD